MKMTDTSVEIQNNKDHKDDVENEEHEEHDPYFEPIIHLPEVHIYSMEEDEEDLVKLRAKLYRYDTSEVPHQWKERGTGEIKILCHLKQNTARVLMRRDRTWKICANHYISPVMELKPNCDSDRAWIWSVPADFADETPKPELLAVRFANAENAKLFKDAFEEAQRILEQNRNLPDEEGTSDESDEANEESDKDDEEENEKKHSESKDESEVIDKLCELQVVDACGKTG
ncbi:ran-specific GTPase-activating protein-like [Daphnia pulicaria]|uniref:ran-specific GTPase-activating protein-like n=1 Tax=Daphnia pulicaria TaxID=35523 RepID=UPI001EEC1A2A|nr:ran-specific GTPase-activating protein-like [Daphnia pulicaria]